MKKLSLILSLFLLCSFTLFSQSKYTAKELTSKALEQGSVMETINFISSNADNTISPSDKRSALAYLAKLQEQIGLYSEASSSYAKAAAIEGKDAKDMQKITNEMLVIGAVRCALCSGDYDTAESYLNSKVRSSADTEVAAYVNLYSVWAELCKAESVEETKDSISLLEAYTQMQSMKCVKSSILLTLWYLTDDRKYSDALEKEFPNSAEYGIITGKVQIMSVPFWYFVPRSAHNSTETSLSSSTSSVSVVTSRPESAKQNIKKQQLGLFREEANANELISRLKSKGFNAYSYTEKRASGTTYYIVVVDENKEETMGLKLRDAGFECYPVVD